MKKKKNVFPVVLEEANERTTAKWQWTGLVAREELVKWTVHEVEPSNVGRLQRKVI